MSLSFSVLSTVLQINFQVSKVYISIGGYRFSMLIGSCLKFAHDVLVCVHTMHQFHRARLHCAPELCAHILDPVHVLSVMWEFMSESELQIWMLWSNSDQYFKNPTWKCIFAMLWKFRHYRQHVLYVQEVVTLQKKYLIYLRQKMRFTPFINYYDTFTEQNNFRSRELNWIKLFDSIF